MLEEILYTMSISPQIEKSILVTREEKAIEIGKKFNTITIIDEKEESVNGAVALADKYLLENNFDASIVLDRKSTRLNSSHKPISYAVFCLKKKTNNENHAS